MIDQDTNVVLARIDANVSNMKDVMLEMKEEQRMLRDTKADKDVVDEIKKELHEVHDSIEARIVAATKPTADQVKKNTNSISKLFGYKTFILGGAAVIGIIWPVVWVIIQHYWLG